LTEHTLSEVVQSTGVTAPTLKRWINDGLIPQYEGVWTDTAVAQARLIARLRARGHSLEEIRAANVAGKLAFGYIEELLPTHASKHTLADAARETGLDPALIERIHASMGFGLPKDELLSDDDVELLRYSAVVLAAGLPLVAFLQMARVYGQSIAQIADAEVRLFHLYVHEPLMRDGIPGREIAEEMEGMARDLLPLAAPFIERLHNRFLAQFVEQDIVGHMESDLEHDALDLGRLRVAIAFADLAGFTRLTEEQGDESAVDIVERLIESVENTLPDDARVIKTLGDEVMVVGSDPTAMAEWAVGFQTLYGDQRPLPRIGVHYGETLYRDGDYYGSEVNRASRVVARAAGGEVLVTRPVVDHGGEHLEFELIGEIRLKGFTEPTELYLARAREIKGEVDG
jgi:adenylate cyclase